MTLRRATLELLGTILMGIGLGILVGAMFFLSDTAREWLGQWIDLIRYPL